MKTQSRLGTLVVCIWLALVITAAVCVALEATSWSALKWLWAPSETEPRIEAVEPVPLGTAREGNAWRPSGDSAAPDTVAVDSVEVDDGRDLRE